MTDNTEKQLIVIEHDEIKTKAALFDGNRLTEYFVENQKNHSLVGNIYRGKVRKVAPQMNALFIDVGLPEMGLLSARDVPTRKAKQKVELKNLFYEGQIVWVQVHKDTQTSELKLDAKGVRLSTELSIESENLVFLPDSSEVFVSKQIIDKQVRDSLKRMVEQSMGEHDIEGGFIIRSNVERYIHVPEESAQNQQWLDDIHALWTKWQEIKALKIQAKKVGLIYQASSLIERLRCQCLQQKIHKISGNETSKAAFEQQRLSFTVLSQEQLNQSLNSLNFHEQLQQALEPLVKLPNGGSIVIEKTEALTSIDVNMGKAIKQNQSAFQVNLDAANMVIQQLILRNIAGMIVVDFIRMERKKDRDALLHYVQELTSEHSVKVKVFGYTRLGLFEMSRERIRSSLMSIVS